MDIQGISPKIEMYDYENIVSKFGASHGTGERDKAKFFSQQWKPFVWAAILGFVENVRIPLEGSLKEDTFKYSTINNNGERIFQTLILFAVAVKGYKILQNTTELNKTIEEYANGGFEIIHEKIRNKPGYFNSPTDYVEFILDWIEE